MVIPFTGSRAANARGHEVRGVRVPQRVRFVVPYAFANIGLPSLDLPERRVRELGAGERPVSSYGGRPLPPTGWQLSSAHIRRHKTREKAPSNQSFLARRLNQGVARER